MDSFREAVEAKKSEIDIERAEQEASRRNREEQERERYENAVRESLEFALSFVSYMNENSVPRSELYGVKSVYIDSSKPHLGGSIQLTGVTLSGWQAASPYKHTTHAWDEGEIRPGVFISEDGEAYEFKERIIENASYIIPSVIDKNADLKPNPTLLAHKHTQERVIRELASRI